jgi:hypothetical protein
MTVGEMLDRISSTELAEWAIYERDYGPLGPGRADQLAALVSATIANAASVKRRYRPADFLPRWGAGRRRRQTPQEQLEIMRAFVSRFQGKDDE